MMYQKNNDDTLYEYVFEETEQGIEPVKSLWARAVALSEGNDNKAKSLYMQYRVQSIKDQLSTLQIDMADLSKEELFELIKNGFTIIPEKLQAINEQKAEAKEQAIKIAIEEEARQESEKYSKFGGWLLIFAVFLVLGNLYGFLGVERYFENASLDILKLLYQNGMDQQATFFNTIAYMTFVSYGLLLAFTISFFRKHRDTKNIAIIYFGYGIIAVPIGFFLQIKINPDTTNVMFLVTGTVFKVLFFVIMLRYFMVSERVNKTFVRGDDENDNNFVIALLLGIAAIALASILYAKASDKHTLINEQNDTSVIQQVTEDATAPVAEEAAAPAAADETDWMKQQCNQGLYSTCVQLGYLYENGQGVVQNSYTAAGLYRKACDGGNSEGCFDLGLLYGNGQGVMQDYYQAKIWYQKACDLGNAGACNNLGVIYANGQGGVSADTSMAAKLYKKACDDGDDWGCNNLGNYYLNGTAVSQDFTKAAQLFKKSCKIGNEDGCKNIAKAEKALYDTMTETDRLQYECDRGNAESCNDLGVKYDNGEDGEQDTVKAAALFKKACEGGNMKGCHNLALDYETGIGVNQDYTKSKKYFKKACRLGDSDACDRANAY